MKIKKDEAVVRIYDLIKEAKALARVNPKISKRRVKAARRVSMKFHLKIPELKNDFCRKCNTYLGWGISKSVRIKSKIRVIKCLNCGCIRRIKLKTS